MPRPRGMGRSSDLTGWSTHAGRPLDGTTPPELAAPAPAPTKPPTEPPAQRRPRKFTALLDADTDARYGRLLADLVTTVGPIATRSDGAGRLRSGYDPSRADLLRALLAVAEHDPAVRAAVHDQVRRDLYHDTTT